LIAGREAANRTRQILKSWRIEMSKIEKVLRELSDLRDFYHKIKNRKANKTAGGIG
jgi:hypothetical protein